MIGNPAGNSSRHNSRRERQIRRSVESTSYGSHSTTGSVPLEPSRAFGVMLPRHAVIAKVDDIETLPVKSYMTSGYQPSRRRSRSNNIEGRGRETDQQWNVLGSSSIQPTSSGGTGDYVHGDMPFGSSRVSEGLNRLLARTRVWSKVKRHSHGARSIERTTRNTADSSPADRSPCHSEGGAATWGDMLPGEGSPALSPTGSVAEGPKDDKILDNLFQLLNSPHSMVREKALSTIFHLAQSSPSARDTILEAGGLVIILREIQRSGPADIHTARALYHLCLGDPLPPFRLVVQTLPYLQRLLLSSDDEEVLVIVCYVLAELVGDSDPSELNYVHKVIPSPLHVRLVHLLSHESVDVRFRVLSLLRLLANADRLQNGATGCEEILRSPSFCSSLRRCLGISELQDEAVAVLQNFIVHHLRELMRDDLLRQYLNIAQGRMGFELSVVQSLCAMLRQADANQLRQLRDWGCASIVGRAISDYENLASCSDEMHTLQSKLGLPR